MKATMTKQEAIALFGATGADLARALGITPQAISQWPCQLRQPDHDQVIGACERLGIAVPAKYKGNKRR